MFKLIKNKSQVLIVNQNGDVVYSPPRYIAIDKRFDFTKLVSALNQKGYRDLETIINFENGKLR